MDAVEAILSRKTPESAAKILGTFADLIDEAVNFGTHVFLICDKATVKDGYHHAAILMLFRHVLEMIDGASILVRTGCSDPCQPLLRSALEAILSIEYILEKDTERRAIAYQVAHIHKRIAQHAQHDPNTEAGRSYQKILNADKLIGAVKLRPYVSARRIDKLAQVLAMPEYTEVDMEWTRLWVAAQRKGKKVMPHWFSVFNGPNSVRQLAFHLKLGACYDSMYSNWSDAIHAGSAMLSVAGTEKTLRPLRFPDKAQYFASMATSFTLRTSRNMINCFDPSKLTDYQQWYTKNVRDFYLKITSHELLKVK